MRSSSQVSKAFTDRSGVGHQHYEVSVSKLDPAQENFEEDSAASDDFVTMSKKKIRQKPHLSTVNRNQEDFANSEQ